MKHSQLVDILKANDEAAVVKSLEGEATVELYDNIGVASAKARATAIESNNIITTINLHNNNISVKDAKALATALEFNYTITTVDLIIHNISVASPKVLATVLESSNTITTISLS